MAAHHQKKMQKKKESKKKTKKEKIQEQFGPYGFDIDKIKGYFFKNNSEFCQRIIKDEDFKNMISTNKTAILKNGEFSSEFPKKGIFGIINNNFKNAVGMVDFKHAYLDNDKNLHIKMYDTYDFNAKGNFLIKAGRSQMQNGNLKPFFVIYDIIIPNSELKKIW